mgnify:CR=1 FL=1
MKTEELMIQAFIYNFLENGVRVDHRDRLTNTVYLSLPENSFYYDENKMHYAPTPIINAAIYVKRIKETLIDLNLIPANLKIQYRTYSGYWTKQMGIARRQKYTKQNQIDVFDFM